MNWWPQEKCEREVKIHAPHRGASFQSQSVRHFADAVSALRRDRSEATTQAIESAPHFVAIISATVRHQSVTATTSEISAASSFLHKLKVPC
jgi:hypothetical protein